MGVKENYYKSYCSNTKNILLIINRLSFEKNSFIQRKKSYFKSQKSYLSSNLAEITS